MFKKVFSILLFSSLLLVGCNNDVKEEVIEDSSTKSNKVSISSSKTYSINDISINDNITYQNKYSFFGNLIALPDSNNNNKLSISNLTDYNSFINEDSLIQFYDYSALNTINVDNIIYFSSNTPNNSGIFKLNYEKNSIDKISDYIPLNLVYQNGYLYFINSTDRFIYSLNLKDNKIGLLSNNKASNLLVTNNFIIYKNLDDNSNLYALKTDKTHNVKLTDVSIDSFIAYKNEILFFDSSNGNILSSLNLANETITRYSNIVGQNLKSSANNIYFIGYEDPNKLYILDRDELTYTLITNDFINDYYPVDDKIFLEMAVSLDKVYILDISNIQK